MKVCNSTRLAGTCCASCRRGLVKQSGCSISSSKASATHVQISRSRSTACAAVPLGKVLSIFSLFRSYLLLFCLPVISQPCRCSQFPFHACCAAHFLDLLPFRITGDCCAAPKAPAPPKSPGELAGAAPNRLLPLLAKLKGDADAEAGAAPAKKPPYRLCPMLTGVLAACGAPSARGAPNVAGALCAAAWPCVSSAI